MREQSFDISSKQALTIDDLEIIRITIRDQQNKLAQNGGLDNFTEMQKRTGRYLEEMLRNMDKFNHVFLTEQGSYYFTLASGATLRLVNRGGLYIPPEVVFQSVFFVNGDQSQIISDAGVNLAALIGKPINTESLRIGLRPFEVGTRDDQAIKIIKNGNTISVCPKNSLLDFVNNPPSAHLGRNITRLIK